jgi:hypothetical protein
MYASWLPGAQQLVNASWLPASHQLAVACQLCNVLVQGHALLSSASLQQQQQQQRMSRLRKVMLAAGTGRQQGAAPAHPPTT